MKKITLVLLVFFMVAVTSCSASDGLFAVPMGLHGTYGDAESIEDLGAKSVRKASLLWQSMEPRKGEYDFRAMDSFVRRLQTTSTNIVVVTLRDISAWGGNFAAQSGYYSSDSRTATSGFPSDIGAWRDFVRTVVERYDGDGVDDMPGLTLPVKYWQVENEWMWQWKDTTENYLVFLDLTYRAIKSADPDAVVVSGAVTGSVAFAVGEGMDPYGYFEKDNGYGGSIRVSREQLLRSKEYWENLDKAHALLDRGRNSFDIVDIHLYSRESYRIPPAVKWLKSVMSGYGYGKAIWSLENGGPLYGYTEDLQASELVKRYVLSVMSDISMIYWSSLRETPAWPKKYRNLALIDITGRKKPAYHTYKLLSSVLNGIGEIEMRSFGDGVHGFGIRKIGNTSLIVWSDTPVSVTLPSDSPEIRITNMVTLESRVLRPTGSLIGIQVGTEPLLVEPAIKLLR